MPQKKRAPSSTPGGGEEEGEEKKKKKKKKKIRPPPPPPPPPPPHGPAYSFSVEPSPPPPRPVGLCSCEGDSSHRWWAAPGAGARSLLWPGQHQGAGWLYHHRGRIHLTACLAGPHHRHCHFPPNSMPDALLVGHRQRHRLHLAQPQPSLHSSGGNAGRHQ